MGSRATLGWPVKVATPADRTLVDIAARLSRPATRETLRGLADPLDDARALLVLTRLLYRARRSAALHGVHGADRAVRALVPIGRRLRAAVEAAERAPAGSAEQRDLLQRVSRSAEELWVAIDDRGEGIRALITVADRGVRGVRDTRPTMPEGLGHRW